MKTAILFLSLSVACFSQGDLHIFYMNEYNGCLDCPPFVETSVWSPTGEFGYTSEKGIFSATSIFAVIYTHACPVNENAMFPPVVFSMKQKRVLGALSTNTSLMQ